MRPALDVAVFPAPTTADAVPATRRIAWPAWTLAVCLFSCRWWLTGRPLPRLRIARRLFESARGARGAGQDAAVLRLACAADLWAGCCSRPTGKPQPCTICTGCACWPRCILGAISLVMFRGLRALGWSLTRSLCCCAAARPAARRASDGGLGGGLALRGGGAARASAHSSRSRAHWRWACAPLRRPRPLASGGGASHSWWSAR